MQKSLFENLPKLVTFLMIALNKEELSFSNSSKKQKQYILTSEILLLESSSKSRTGSEDQLYFFCFYIDGFGSAVHFE